MAGVKYVLFIIKVQLTCSRIIDILNFVWIQTIYPVSWSSRTWSKRKTLGTSNLIISNICIRRTTFSVPWAVFSHYLELFPKFPKFFNFSYQISIFSTPAGIIAAILQAKMSKDSQIELSCSFFFSFFFLIEYFDSIFWSLGYSIKVLFKYHFTENYRIFERKTNKTVVEKCKALKDLEKGMSNKRVAGKYNVLRNAVSTWLKNKGKLLTSLGKKRANSKWQKLHKVYVKR